MVSLPHPANNEDDFRRLVETAQCGNPRCACQRVRNTQAQVHCPAHDDTTPSLSVTLRDGRLLVHCHGGCSFEEVRRALAARGLDLFGGNRAKSGNPRQPQNRTISVTYRYPDEQGRLLFEVVRFTPKAFAQRRPNGAGGWTWDLDGTRRVLYRLPELLAAPLDRTVYMAEGEKDVDSLVALGFVATTNPGGAGKWSAEYGEVLRGRHVVILPDNDDPGRAHAQQVAQALYGVAASVKIVKLPGLPPKGDVSDWLDAGNSREALEALVARTPQWTPHPVPDPAGLLDRVRAFVLKYVVLSPSQSVAIALWVLHAWVIDAFDATPYLAITSPEKRSGKTRLLEVLEPLLPVALRVANISDAALFRTIADTSQGRVVILLDEADAVFNAKGNREDLRALLNAGYRRGAMIARCEGEGRSIRVERYDAFGAKALAAIGELPDTIADRSIPIRMQRRAKHETVARFRLREVRAEAATMRDTFAAWATPEVIEALRAARPEIPAELDDRAADGWEPLLAVADLAGQGWSECARQAALDLHGAQVAVESSRVLLLRHIMEVFEEAGTDRLPTATLLRALVTREDGPWAAWWANDVEAERTKGPAAKLAALLRPFGIAPKKIRVGDGLLQGYERATIFEVWSRYAPAALTSAQKSEQSEQGSPDAAFGDFGSRNTGASVPTLEGPQKAVQMRIVPSVPSLPAPGRGKANDGMAPLPSDAPTDGDFEAIVSTAKALFGGEVVCDNGESASSREAGSATPPRLLSDAPTDGGLRVAFLRCGQDRGWPPLPYKPGHSVVAGEQGWRTFVAASADQEITLALKAAQDLDGQRRASALSEPNGGSS